MAGPPPYREPIGALKDPMHPPPFGLGQVSFQVMGGEGWQGQRNCETPPGQERSETPLLVLFSLNEYKFLSTQRSFSQPFASLINNNSGGGQSRSAAAVPPAYSAQCKGDSWDSLEGGSPQASGQPLGLAVNCVSRKMLQWGSCRKPCSPLPSRLCGCFSQPLPPPQLLGKFSIKLLGGGVVRAAAGEEWWWKEEGARGLQRRANWGTAAGRRACTHAHTHARMHARPPGAAAMQGPSRTGWPRCARRPPGLRQGTRAVEGPGLSPPLGENRDVQGELRARVPAADATGGSCFAPSVALLSILRELFAPSSHPRGEEMFWEENFCLHLILKMDLFAKLKAGWGTPARSIENPLARERAAAVVAAAFVPGCSLCLSSPAQLGAVVPAEGHGAGAPGPPVSDERSHPGGGRAWR